MPCIYAHDVFGKKVFQNLPKVIQVIIRQNPKEFRIGLQGPDIFFFYHPLFRSRINRIGQLLHNQSMTSFLETTIPLLQKKESLHGTYAYLLGCICHFALDSECHSYVIPQAGLPGYNHLGMEHAFDRYLLKKNGHLSYRFPAWKIIPNNNKISESICHAYHSFNLSENKVQKVLNGMRFYKWLLDGHAMVLSQKRNAADTNYQLYRHYKNAIPLAVSLVTNFHLHVTTGTALSERFNTTFKSNR